MFGGPTSVAIADFNGDGNRDLAFQGGIASGRGDGTFGPAQGVTCSNTDYWYITAADLDGDGRPDMVSSNNYATSLDATLSILFNRLPANLPPTITPTITWPAPAAITYGTALSSTQLDATASVRGSYLYTPPAGTVLSAGTQTLSVTFTPTDTTDYTTATATVTLVVKKVSSATTITSHTPNPSRVGRAVTVAFGVTGNGVPTGSVTVRASTGESCSGPLSSSTGNCSLTFNTAGSRTLTASYGGDSNFNGSSSARVTQTVQR